MGAGRKNKPEKEATDVYDGEKLKEGTL